MKHSDWMLTTGILEAFSRVDGFTAGRQNLVDELRRAGGLTMTQLIDLRDFYRDGTWNNVVSVEKFDCQQLEAAHRYYVNRNPVVPIQPRLTRKTAIFRHTDLIGTAKWSESDFVKDFVRHYNMLDGVNMLLYDSRNELRWGFGSGHPKVRGVKREFVQVLKVLAAPLSRAIENAENWHILLESYKSLNSLLTGTEQPIALVQGPGSSGSARLLTATPAAQRLLGVHNCPAARNPALASFLEASLSALDQVRDWTDCTGRACRISSVRALQTCDERPNLIVRIEICHQPTVTPPVLSLREHKILEHVSQGSSDKEIAAALNISPHTVRAHLRKAFAKLGASGRIDAVNRVFGRHHVRE